MSNAFIAGKLSGQHTAPGVTSMATSAKCVSNTAPVVAALERKTMGEKMSREEYVQYAEAMGDGIDCPICNGTIDRELKRISAVPGLVWDARYLVTDVQLCPVDHGEYEDAMNEALGEYFSEAYTYTKMPSRRRKRAKS